MLRIEFRLDEGLVEFPMVVRSSAQTPFKISVNGELTRSLLGIFELQRPDFQIVTKGNEKPQRSLDTAMQRMEDSVTDSMPALIVLWLLHHRLDGRAPIVAGLLIAQIEIFAPIILNEVLLPAGQAIKVRMGNPAKSAINLRND